MFTQGHSTLKLRNEPHHTQLPVNQKNSLNYNNMYTVFAKGVCTPDHLAYMWTQAHSCLRNLLYAVTLKISLH